MLKFRNDDNILEMLGGTYLEVEGGFFEGEKVTIHTDIPCRGKTRRVYNTPDDLEITINGWRFGYAEFD